MATLSHTPSLSNSHFLSRTSCIPSTSALFGKTLTGKTFIVREASKLNRHFVNAKGLRPMAATESGKSPTATVSGRSSDGSEKEVDSLVETISFGQLCDDFECISSPAVERTARQLARDILSLKENARLLSCFSMNVKYKDPLRSFTGREKYKRVSWINTVLENPSASVLKMEMQSSSDLIIKWKVKGKIKIPPASFLGQELCLIVLSKFKLNQISGQVIENMDEWDLSQTSPLSAVFFWSSRAAWSITELANDGKESINSISEKFKGGNEGSNIYADPTDPRRFFQQNNPNSELYQIGLFIALMYLLVQTLRLVL